MIEIKLSVAVEAPEIKRDPAIRGAIRDGP
jgi:hypothetical protein